MGVRPGGPPARLPALDPRRDAALISGAILVAATLATALPAGERTLAVYALSFWHYPLYWLAYRHGTVAPAVFRRDAIAMKAVSLAALGAAYLPAAPQPASVVVVAAGFLLNCAAARALGAERTYYGHELAALPAQVIRSFPYSLLPHPMLAGNMLAFAGTLLDPEFRAHWWPLACAHVACNAALLLMEVAVSPGRGAARGVPRPCARLGSRRAARGLLAAVAAAGLAAPAAAWAGAASPAVALGALALVHAVATWRCYTCAPGAAAAPRERAAGDEA